MDTKNIIKNSFHFLRHGQTNGNVSRLLQGTYDEPLNEMGIIQAKRIAKKLKEENISHIAASPLKRALTTAQIVSDEIKKPITIIDELHEVSFGKLENCQNPDEDPEKFFYKWIEDKIDTKHEIESLGNFKKRISSALKKTFEIPQNPILIVSHSIVYYAICDLFDLEFNQIDNCQHKFHETNIDFS
ncbi:MAG: histidine phosphatase family protein [Bacteroidetes bacterium]|nr:histidine phosphatase family protein [Bacteroidota bacterium]